VKPLKRDGVIDAFGLAMVVWRMSLLGSGAVDTKGKKQKIFQKYSWSPASWLEQT
jgi:hypothetical protein